MPTKKSSSDEPNAESSSHKKSDRDSSAAASARSTISGPSKNDGGAPAGALAKKMQQTEALAAAMPFNANKPGEYGDASIEPDAGATVGPDHPRVTGSTLTETTASAKVGAGAPKLGLNPANLPLDRVRVDSSAQTLTTNLGVPVADNQNSLKAGLRGPALLEDFILREKITHFDHERIPERIVHARGSAAHGYFECYKPMTERHARVALRRGRQAHAGVRALLDRHRRARLDRHGARRARLRGEVLHRRRQLGSGRQQHPRVLHPGRDEVPRPGPRRQARAALRACRRRRRRTTRSGTSSR